MIGIRNRLGRVGVWLRRVRVGVWLGWVVTGVCNALFNYLIILLDVMIYVYILYVFDDYVTYL